MSAPLRSFAGRALAGWALAGMAAVALAGRGVQDGSAPWATSFDLAADLVDEDPLGAAELLIEELEQGPLALESAQLEVGFRLGNALVEAREFETAARLQVALHLSAKAEWSAINATLTLSQLGRQDEARALLEALVAEQPQAAGAWSHLGLMAWAQGDLDGARRGFGRAALLGSEDARSNLGRMELRAGRTREARAWFRSGLAGETPGAWSLRGWGLTLLPGAER